MIDPIRNRTCPHRIDTCLLIAAKAGASHFSCYGCDGSIKPMFVVPPSTGGRETSVKDNVSVLPPKVSVAKPEREKTGKHKVPVDVICHCGKSYVPHANMKECRDCGKITARKQTKESNARYQAKQKEKRQKEKKEDGRKKNRGKPGHAPANKLSNEKINIIHEMTLAGKSGVEIEAALGVGVGTARRYIRIFWKGREGRPETRGDKKRAEKRGKGCPTWP